MNYVLKIYKKHIIKLYREMNWSTITYALSNNSINLVLLDDKSTVQIAHLYKFSVIFFRVRGQCGYRAGIKWTSAMPRNQKGRNKMKRCKKIYVYIKNNIKNTANLREEKSSFRSRPSFVTVLRGKMCNSLNCYRRFDDVWEF